MFGFPRYDGGEESLEIKTAFADYRAVDEAVGESRSAPRPVLKGKGTGKTRAAQAKTPEPKPVVYVVKKNNNLAVVAEMFRVEKEDVRKWSPEGQPGHGRAETENIPGGQWDMVSYKVKKGDTITEICQSLKVRPKDLIAGNGLKNGLSIKQGQMLVVYRTAVRRTSGGVVGRREKRGPAGVSHA